MDDFTYTTGRLDSGALRDLRPDFDTLRPSIYADGAYRLRRYSRFTVDAASGTLDLLPSADFVQGDDLNTFQGNVRRRYDDLLATTWDSAGFRALCAAFVHEGDLPSPVTIEVHQLRVIAAPGESVPTAPEGVHQDGFDRICIVTIDRAGAGAVLGLHREHAAGAFAELDQAPGDFVVLNDAVLWHSATPVVASTDAPAHWDAFVLTARR